MSNIWRGHFTFSLCKIKGEKRKAQNDRSRFLCKYQPELKLNSRKILLWRDHNWNITYQSERNRICVRKKVQRVFYAVLSSFHISSDISVNIVFHVYNMSPLSVNASHLSNTFPSVSIMQIARIQSNRLSN